MHTLDVRGQIRVMLAFTRMQLKIRLANEKTTENLCQKISIKTTQSLTLAISRVNIG